MAGEVAGAYVKVVLEEKGRAGLNEEVRAAIPGAVDVVLARPEEPARGERVTRAGRSPVDLFTTYLTARGVDDPVMLDLFRELEQEAVQA
jgi:hypothetical protein